MKQMNSIVDKLPIISASGRNWQYYGNEIYRYILAAPGDNQLVCIGANSSTAVPGHLDPTLKTVDRVAKLWGYDGFVMLNLSPLRATNPRDLPLAQDEKLYWTNIECITSVLSQYKNIYCAWGNLIDIRPYMDIWKDISLPSNANWLRRGPLSKNGNPHHPLYVKAMAPLERFDMQSYIEKRKLIANSNKPLYRKD